MRRAFVLGHLWLCLLVTTTQLGNMMFVAHVSGLTVVSSIRQDKFRNYYVVSHGLKLC